MQIRILADTEVLGMPEDMEKRIKKALTISNPEYYKRQNMGLSVYGISPQIRLYKHGPGGSLIVPRGYMSDLLTACREKGMSCRLFDHRVTRPHVDWKSRIELRDYQEAAVVEMLRWTQGILIAPCGSGKTEMALELAARIGQPTLWITHTKDLAKQAADRAIAKTAANVGMIGAGEQNVGRHLTVGTVQSLVKIDASNPLWQKFGCVIVDECHRCFKNEKSAGQFSQVLERLPARYRFGVTASEHRSDGLIETMFAVIGPKIHEVSQSILETCGHVIVPAVTFVETNYWYEGDSANFSQMLSDMGRDVTRNDLILQTIRRNAPGNCGIALGDGLQQLRYLHSVLAMEGIETRFICGSTPKREREQILREMREGAAQVLLATYALAKEGLDIPRANQLYLLTPKKDKTVIQQSVGRIMRPFPGKDSALVFDFFDGRMSLCRHHARCRIRDVYREQGCAIDGGPAFRGEKNVRESATGNEGLAPLGLLSPGA